MNSAGVNVLRRIRAISAVYVLTILNGKLMPVFHDPDLVSIQVGS